jgi:hypothetical protein
MFKREMLYIILIIIAISSVVVFSFNENLALAITFEPQVIDDIGFKETEINGRSIGILIQSIYTYALGIVGILATLVMMYGGVLYITAAGNASKMDNAKQWIFSALTGLILALSSYTLLYMVNPNLLKMTSIDPIKPTENKPTEAVVTNVPCSFGAGVRIEGAGTQTIGTYCQNYCNSEYSIVDTNCCICTNYINLTLPGCNGPAVDVGMPNQYAAGLRCAEECEKINKTYGGIDGAHSIITANEGKYCCICEDESANPGCCIYGPLSRCVDLTATRCQEIYGSNVVEFRQGHCSATGSECLN